MKKAAVAKIIIYSFTALLLTAIMIVGILFNHGVFRYATSGIIKYQENEESGFSPAGSDTMTFTDIESIEIEWVAGDVTIKRGDGDTVTVSESADFEMNDNQKMRFSQIGDTLIIKFCKPILHWGFGTNNVKSKTLTVTLPEKLYDSVSVETVSADVGVYHLNADVLDIETVSGWVSIWGVDVSELDCESVSGDLDATDFKAGEIDCDTVSGNIIIAGMVLNSGSFNSVSGKMDVYVSPEKLYALEMNTFSGKTTIYGNNNVNTGDKRADVKISMESFSGDITFRSNLVSIDALDDEYISSLPENIQQYIEDINAG